MPEALQPAVSDMASPYTSSEKFKMLEKSPKIMSKIQSSPKYKSINPRSENPRQELIEPENYQHLNSKHEPHIVSVSVLQKMQNIPQTTSSTRQLCDYSNVGQDSKVTIS